MKTKLYTLIFLFASLLGRAQEIDKAKLDDYFDVLEKNNKFMGSVSISKDGVTIYNRETGFAEVEKQRKPDRNTKYRIGSISKTFTAVLVFKAIEENKLALTQTIAKYFPAIKNADNITIAHLLGHRSGIHNFTDDPEYLKWNTQKKTEQEMLAIIAKGGTDFEPDSKTAYSNSNYVLLTFILEKIYKKPYATLITERITKPLELKNTYVGGKINIAANESYSYENKNKKWERQPETDMSVPVGAGAIVSTPEDLTRFADALFAGKLVSEKSLSQMKTIREGIGMGLFQIPFYERISYGHNGGIDGFRSVLGYFPNEKIAFALTTNGTAIVPNNVAIAMLSAVFGRPVEIPEFNTFEPNPGDLDLYLGTYASQQIPVKITVTRNGNELSAQGSGQPAFTLQPSAKDKFRFDAAGIVMEFVPAEKKMVLKQGGGVFDFRKE